jgi:hypothetical protein
MKRLVLVAGILLMLVSMGQAAPVLCVGLTLQSAIAQGTSGCVLNDLLFVFDTPTTVTQNPPYASTPTSYAYFATVGSQPATTDGSDVTLLSGGTDSITFQSGNWTTRSNQARTIDIVFTVEAYQPANMQITGLENSSPISGPGTASATCTSGCGSTVIFTNTATPVAVGPIPNQNFITVENLIALGTGASSHTSTLADTFQVNNGSNFNFGTPEPSVAALSGIGVLLIAAGMRRRKTV